MSEAEAVPEGQLELGGIVSERVRKIHDIGTEFPLLDPAKMHTDYECPYCGYGWNGRPNARALTSNVHLRSGLMTAIEGKDLASGSVAVADIIRLLEADVSTT